MLNNVIADHPQREIARVAQVRATCSTDGNRLGDAVAAHARSPYGCVAIFAQVRRA